MHNDLGGHGFIRRRQRCRGHCSGYLLRRGPSSSSTCQRASLVRSGSVIGGCSRASLTCQSAVAGGRAARPKTPRRQQVSIAGTDGAVGALDPHPYGIDRGRLECGRRLDRQHYIPVHRSPEDAKRRAHANTIGLSRFGQTTKMNVHVDAQGRNPLGQARDELPISRKSPSRRSLLPVVESQPCFQDDTWRAVRKAWQERCTGCGSTVRDNQPAHHPVGPRTSTQQQAGLMPLILASAKTASGGSDHQSDVSPAARGPP